MGHTRSPKAEEDLDDIWLHTARVSGALGTADKLIDAITAVFFTIADHPGIGRRREELGTGLRSFPTSSYVIFYRENGPDVEIVRILHGSRDIPGLFE